MLVHPSLELARAHRRKRPLLFCRTNSLEVATAAVQAATVAHAPLVLTIDARRPAALSHLVIAHGMLTLGREASVMVSVEVMTPAHKPAIEWWLERGVLALTIADSLDKLEPVARQLAPMVQAYGAELGLAPQEAGLQDFARLSKTVQPAFMRIQGTLRSTELRERVEAVEVPLVCDELTDSLRKNRELITAGVQGITVDSMLQETFTAGIRTGLRNRSVDDPAYYLGKGSVAVRDAVLRLYTTFHQ
jgi:fructose/tagatose bisphosphate aldolase